MSITIEGRVWEGVRESCGKQGPLQDVQTKGIVYTVLSNNKCGKVSNQL